MCQWGIVSKWECSRLDSEKSVQRPILFSVFINDLGVHVLIKRVDTQRLAEGYKK